MALVAQLLSSAMYWISWLFTLLFLYLGYYGYTKMKRSRLPPGPTPLPIIGSALEVLGRPLHVTFSLLQKAYGNIFCLQLGGADVVVINGYDNIKAALVTNAKKFNGRPNITWTSITQKHGIFSIEGPAYYKQKALIIHLLSEVGWDKCEEAEVRIQQTGEDLVKWLRDKVNSPINPQIYLDTAICNVTSKPLMSLTFKPSDDLMIAVSRIAMDIFIDAGAQNVNNYFPFLRDFPGDPTNYHALMKNAVTAMDVLKGVIKSHKEKMEAEPDAPKVDFIDHYLHKIKEGTEPTCTDHQLLAVVTDLFAMGIEASATTLRWALLLVAQHPKVQIEIQREIDEVVQDSTPSLKHKPEMNYTNSVIAEVQRYVNLVSINLPHSTTDDVTFQGFHIPKGTVVIPNLASVHLDELTYPGALNFQPERFLKADGFNPPEKFMPYSAGTRICIGRNISQWQIFLLLTAILQNFDLKLFGDVGDDIYGLIRYPAPYQLTFSERQKTQANNNVKASEE